MNVDLIPAHELDPSLVALWSQIQRANRALHSPFFRPEFTQLCAQVHGDVEIGVLRDGAKPVAFFPFHRIGRRSGVPIGKDMSDFQGMIAPRDLDWSLDDLLRGCRLSDWSFNHLIADCRQITPHAITWAESPFMDLEGGFEAYHQRKRSTGSKGVEGVERSYRLLLREFGEMKSCLHDVHLNELSLMLAWQRENLERQGTLFLDRGCRREAMIEAVLSHDRPEFSGWFSTLRAGGQLLAGTIYLRSYDTCHWWITSYHAAHSRHSPGAVALLLAAKEAAEMGITRIDLGRGMQELKRRLMSGSEMVGEGLVEGRPLVGTLRRAYARASHLLWDSPLKVAAKEMLAHWRQWHAVKPIPREER